MKKATYSNFMIAAGAGILLLGSLAPASIHATYPAAVTLDEKYVASPGPGGWLERATEMMSVGNYAGVIDQINRLFNTGVALTEEERENTLYMYARAYYERGDAECVELLRAFIGSYPASEHVLEAKLTIADYYYFEHQFGQAYAEYCDVPMNTLSGDTRRRYEYRKALSALKSGYVKESAPLFRQLQGDKEYAAPATFYLAYIDYREGRLGKAYEGFQQAAAGLEQLAESGDTSGRRGMRRRLDYVPTAPIAEYYMLQIDFARGEYRKVIDGVKRLVTRRPVQEFLPETNRLLGESYFKLGDYDRAHVYLFDYESELGRNAKNSAVYALAVTDYRQGDLDTAEQLFSRLTSTNNELAQSAYLYLGQIAVQRGDYTTAAIDFNQAYSMAWDASVSEAALYNYIAAATHGGSIPFTSSIEMLEDFRGKYPHSDYSAKIDEYLATAYYNEKDYARALASIEKIPNPSDKVLGAKQKILYELGIEKLSNRQSDQAAQYLSEAVKLSRYNRELADNASLWLGDALYDRKDYKGAVSAYTRYLGSASPGANRTLALYDLAYARYMQGSYADARTLFDDALKAAPALDTQLRNDARIRLADCQYYTGRYADALKNYDRAVADRASESDYARYRGALMQGLLGNTQAKLNALTALAADSPASPWAASALLEKGSTLSAMGKNREAAATLEQVAALYPKTAEARRAMLRMAMAQSAAGDTDGAEETYRKVVHDWPASEEATLAHEDLRKINAARGTLADYAAYLQTIPGAPRLDNDQMEELTFEAAETAFAANIAATARLEEYVTRYPEGKHLAQALLDLAEGTEARGDKKGAVAHLDRLLSRRPEAPQSTEALFRKATLLETSDRAAALKAWRELAAKGDMDYMTDAQAGIMRTTDDPDEVLAASRRVQATGADASTVEEAAYFEAQSLQRKGEHGAAVKIYERLASNPRSLSGAKSAVALGEALLAGGDTERAVKTLTAFTETGTPHQYWLARGYIVLADAYHKQGKDYLALEYIQSLADNYPGKESDIRNMINTRLQTWKR